MKRVSVIIPCYNQGKYVAEAIESVLNQTYKNIQIVVVNDASSDDSASIIEEYAKRYSNILFFNEKQNNGVIYSRNMAIQVADGEYILPLDADDKIEPTYIEKAVKILDEKLDVKIVYCRAKFFGNKNKEFKLCNFSHNKLLFLNHIFVSALFRKSDFILSGGYKDYMKNGFEDWDLWLSFLENTKNQENCAYRIDEILFFYRQHSSKSRNMLSSEKKITLYKNLLLNHQSLYFKNLDFFDRLFRDYPKKFAKYKRLFKYSLCINIITFFVIIILFIGRV